MFVLRSFFMACGFLYCVGELNGADAASPAPATIRVDEKPTRWTLSTENSSYQVILTSNNDLTPGYFGPLSSERRLAAPYRPGGKKLGTVLREIPYRGGYVEMTPSLEVVFADRVRELELVFHGYEVIKKNGRPCLKLEMADSHYPLRVTQFIRVIAELDIYEKWLEVQNTGTEEILLERVDSGSLLLPPGSYDLHHLAGDWGREFLPESTHLTSGLKSLYVHALSRSHQYPPFFAVRPAGENSEDGGPVWFGVLCYSNNWRLDFNVNRYGLTQISGGINFWDTHWRLASGAKFVTPKLIYGVSTDGANGASRRLHRYMLDYLLPSPMNAKPHKVLYNSWYATLFDVTAEHQIALAKIAKQIGVELFVIDDGWFKGRTNGNSGLGDWTPDRTKFPDGLGPLVQAVNDLGMDFGVWIEPEMVNPNSDLYRAHPDWVLRTPHRTSHMPNREQLMLNLARDDVADHIIRVIDMLLKENNIRFIKWDSNRHASELGWPEADPAEQRELRIRYIANLYRIFDTIRRKHPNVVIESCSGGGGRTDPGILARADQVWTSDNTDPGDRLRIQYGCSYAFPAKVMTNWVTDHEWHNKTTPLEFRFHVAMAGNLGVGCDLLKWSAEDVTLAKNLIHQYKAVRHIIQLGDQYRLWSPFRGTRTAVQFVTRDGSESVVFVSPTLETETMERRYQVDSDRLVLKGLDPDATYSVTGEQRAEATVSGKVLMNSGILVDLRGNYSSRVIVIKKR